MIDLLFLIIIIALVLIVAVFIRIVPDKTRYAVFQAGKFIELKGPGLLVKLQGRSQRWLRVSVGDRADMIDARLAMINGVHMPIKVENGVKSGVGMRVSGFEADKILIGSERP